MGETLYKLLIWTLKHRGIAGDFPTLLENVWSMDKNDANEMGKKLKRQDRQRTEEIGSSNARKVMKAAALLNKYFRDSKLDLGLESGKTGQFRLTRMLNYALIEII